MLSKVMSKILIYCKIILKFLVFFKEIFKNFTEKNPTLFLDFILGWNNPNSELLLVIKQFTDDKRWKHFCPMSKQFEFQCS